MKIMIRTLALLLCTALLGAGCVGAAEAADAGEADWERLYGFVTEEGPDWSEGDPTYASLRAKEYAQERLEPSQDYALVGELWLYDFTQAQFEEFLPQMPLLRELHLSDCAITDYAPLLPVSAQLALALDWQPGLPALLAALPDLHALEVYGLPMGTDLSPLAVWSPRLTLSLYWEPGMLAWLAALPDLKALELDHLPDDTDLSPLAALTGLVELTIWVSHDPDVDAQALPMLPPMPHLRSLAYAGTGYRWNTVIPALPDLPALEAFYTTADIDLGLLRHTPALRVLSISGAEDFGPLGQLPALEELYIDYSLPGDLSPLYGLPALRLLEIDANEAYPVVDYVDQLEALHEHAPQMEIRLFYCC